jgi:hypothetical protein
MYLNLRGAALDERLARLPGNLAPFGVDQFSWSKVTIEIALKARLFSSSDVGCESRAG